MLTELQKTRESNRQLEQSIGEKLAKLENFTQHVSNVVSIFEYKLSQASANQEKAAKLLRKAITELGLGE